MKLPTNYDECKLYSKMLTWIVQAHERGATSSETDPIDDSRQNALNLNASVTRMYLNNVAPPRIMRDQDKNETSVANAISEDPSGKRNPASHRDVRHVDGATVDSEPGRTFAAATSAPEAPGTRVNRRTGASSKRQRKITGAVGAWRKAAAATKSVTYSDLGGIDAVLYEVQQLIEFPIKHPEVYEWLGVQPPRGVLLYGPPGCGKTALANAIATECKVPFFRISAPEIVSGMSGAVHLNYPCAGAIM
jgi:hypothetical protein